MKKVNKSALPQLLSAYAQNNPNDTWDQLKNNDQNASKQVKKTLIADQRGLCAYCEIDMAQYQGEGLDDFRVEHFYPKKPHNPPPNRALDWSNMLGVCCGGNTRDVGDPSRFVPPKPKAVAKINHSCDVPKGDNNWVGAILDPLQIPAFPPLFEFDEGGAMKVSSACPAGLKALAQGSIDKLHLSPVPTVQLPEPRLLRLRKAVLAKLADDMMKNVDSGMTLEAAAKELSESYFPEKTSQPWPAFFSCIRWYLGPAAEARLHYLSFNG